MARIHHLTQPARLRDTFQRFVHTESASGVVLLVCTAVALLWANSPWGDSYFGLWQQHLRLQLQGFVLDKTLTHWINDGLMALFFLLVGLEIKREAVVGELSSPKQAALPILTALGGMVVPALIYATFNAGGIGAAGWGIPMATDIAFALGILSLAGRGVPLSLKVMLTALAIVDDLGAVVVIALFYTQDLQASYLLLAGLVLGALLLLNYLNVRSLTPYMLLGVVLWYAVLKSGVHATIAGVCLAFCIPVRSKINNDAFLSGTDASLDQFRDAFKTQDEVLMNEQQMTALHHLHKLAKAAQSPLQRLEHTLKYPVAFFIIPLFVLCNAGVAFGADVWDGLLHPVGMGVALGLLLGKPIGIVLATWLSIKLKIAVMPTGANWAMVLGLGCLAGIGFTMSLFVTELAFGQPALTNLAKTGILFGTLFSAILGTYLIQRSTRTLAP